MPDTAPNSNRLRSAAIAALAVVFPACAILVLGFGGCGQGKSRRPVQLITRIAQKGRDTTRADRFLALLQIGHFEDCIAVGANQLLGGMGRMHEVGDVKPTRGDGAKKLRHQRAVAPLFDST